jgi:leader peptidase (prepilin peptidase) / N-methyltransferase
VAAPPIGSLAGAGFVLLAAVIVGIGPRGLLAQVEPRTPPPPVRLWLTLAAAGAGLAAFICAQAYGAPLEAWRLGVVAACLAGVLVFDARYLVIPDLYVLLLALVAAAGIGRLGWLQAGLGAALGGGLLWGVRALFLRFRGVEGLGLGDVKLIAALGGLVGPEHVLWIIIAAAVLGAVWIGLRRKPDPAGQVVAPFGAAAAGPALVVFALTRLTS